MFGEPFPFLDKTTIGKTQGDYTSFDLGRGCPYQCSFCTIINVQGRTMRARDPHAVAAAIATNHRATGTAHYFFTDDSANGVYDLDPGSDGLPGTADDSWTFFDTSGVGSGEPSEDEHAPSKMRSPELRSR